MCSPGSTISFCTCDISGDRLPEQYWVLYRHSKSRDRGIVGEATLPLHYLYAGYYPTVLWLLEALNNQQPFDIPVEPEKGNILEVHLRLDRGDHGSFYFEYDGTIWQEGKEEDFVLLMDKDNQLRTGKLECSTDQS
jgi:hypothetical protein